MQRLELEIQLQREGGGGIERSFCPAGSGQHTLLQNGCMAQCSGFDPSTKCLLVKASDKESVREDLLHCSLSKQSAFTSETFDSVSTFKMHIPSNTTKERLSDRRMRIIAINVNVSGGGRDQVHKLQHKSQSLLTRTHFVSTLSTTARMKTTIG